MAVAQPSAASAKGSAGAAAEGGGGAGSAVNISGDGLVELIIYLMPCKPIVSLMYAENKYGRRRNGNTLRRGCQCAGDVTRLDRVLDECIRCSLEIVPFPDKVVESGLRWFRHVKRVSKDVVRIGLNLPEQKNRDYSPFELTPVRAAPELATARLQHTSNLVPINIF
ncbi:hypothetical protein EVAR_21886_1 [Eumeta japonica]|uniref:Uncharacterized protein n=1 Tax=Eumeta variegata TaxID=151549 RepID=A0A4C1V8D5_EUMVA|nr:hypothetical protein EVAR_21886_1 [Eumeta japonica]